MRTRTYIIIMVCLVLVNIPAHWLLVRWDMTGDKRYTLSETTKSLVRDLDAPLEVEILLEGEMNAGFLRLKQATADLLTELSYYGRVKDIAPREQSREGLTPSVIIEHQQNGQNQQRTLYPYLILHYKGQTEIVNLLRNQRGKSGEENLNTSIQNMEYAFAEATYVLLKRAKNKGVDKIAFLEGHNESSEYEVFDISTALSRYFQIDRGTLGNEAGVLDEYKALIIANPQQPFSEADKYILDQYLMQGGRILWLVDGVQFSKDMMTANGITPIIASDLNLTDMFFRYGWRINPVLVQDMQCSLIPVDVSKDAQQPSFQPMPWTFAPLLLTSQNSPITKDIMYVSGQFVSALDIVGGEDGLSKQILLATSSASGFTSAPAQVDLSDLSTDKERFPLAFIPVALSVEGQFTSLYAHLSKPDEVVQHGEQRKQSVNTRQVVVASGSIVRNDWQQGQPLPCGFDRYTQTQFGNRDFIVNAILFLTNEHGLISLREKSVQMRLLNDQRSHSMRQTIQCVSIVAPVLLLALVGGIIIFIRKKQYTK